MFAKSATRRTAQAGFAGFALTLALAATGCTSTAEPVPSDDTATDIGAVVQVVDNAYEPAEVTIKPGQAVRWEFVDRDKHDVVSSDRSFVSELLPAGNTYTHIFDDAGDYAYTCSIHPEMVGLVVVSD